MANLTKEQREHYEMLVEKYGQPPEGATHFDMEDPSVSSWVKVLEDGTFARWYVEKDLRNPRVVPIPITTNHTRKDKQRELTSSKFVCVELDSDEAVVGDLDTILYWQEERGIPARRCVYYTVGEEIDFKDIVKQSRSE